MPAIALPALALDPDLDAWDRQPQETTLRYAQFRTYLDDGRARTLRKAAETLARHPSWIRAVAGAYRWVERAEAFDRHRDDLDEKVWLEARRQAAERDRQLLDAAVGKVAQRLLSIQPTDLAPAELVRLLDVTMRHRRALFGDPGLTVAVTGAAGDSLAAQLAELAGMTSDQRRAAVTGMAEDVMRRVRALRGDGDDE
jgi:hypothetical protein